MKTITAIEPQRKRSSRVNVFLDGVFAFGLEGEVAAGVGLRVGQALSQAQIEDIARTDVSQRCYQAALRFLSYRPRSRKEVVDRLRRRGFDPETVEGVVGRLIEKGLLDDGAFARFWRESRETFRPRSRRLMEQELRWKGVGAQTAEEALEGLDEEENAFRAGQKKARSLSALDRQDFRKKLGDHLRRRGFSWVVTRRVVERLWAQRRPG
ncbi:MAG: regulatory protein RecX [Dehalococcoidia bacterium]